MKNRKMLMKEVVAYANGIDMMVAKEVDFDIEIGFDLALSRGNCKTHLEAYNTQRNAILKKYGKDPTGSGKFVITPKNMVAYTKDSKVLDEKTVTVSIMEAKIKRENLKGAKLPLEFFTSFKDFVE